MGYEYSYSEEHNSALFLRITI